MTAVAGAPVADKAGATQLRQLEDGELLEHLRRGQSTPCSMRSSSPAVKGLSARSGRLALNDFGTEIFNLLDRKELDFGFRDKAPPMPAVDDRAGFDNFLKLYQRGLWDPTEYRPAASGRRGSSTPPRSRTTKVREPSSGQTIESYEFFKRWGWLAPPPVPRELMKKREAALRRHGFTKAHRRPVVDSYVSLAQRVFKADFVSITTFCTDPSFVAFISQVGTGPIEKAPMSQTLCGHADLLETELLTVRDIKSDWRWAHNFEFNTPDGHPLRFYSSVPVMLSCPRDRAGAQNSDDEEEDRIAIGRFTIMRKDPWPEFGAEDAAVLASIANMASRALENERLQDAARTTRRMQKAQGALNRNLDRADLWPQQVGEDSLPYEVARMACETIAGAVGADLVECVDLSSFGATAARTTAPAQVTASTSSSSMAAAAAAEGGASSSARRRVPSGGSLTASYKDPSDSLEEQLRRTSWSFPQGSVSSPVRNRRPGLSSVVEGEDVAPDAPHMGAAGHPTPNSRRGSIVPLTPSISVEQAPQRRASTAFASALAAAAAAGGEAKPEKSAFVTTGLPNCHSIATAGSKLDLCLRLASPAASEGIISEWIESRCGLQNPRRPDVFQATTAADDLDDDSLEPCSPELPRDSRLNPLGPLLSPETMVYIVAPIIDEGSQPIAAFVISWTDASRQVEDEDLLFINACSSILSAHLLRQQTRRAERSQLEFVRRAQHELRTPLHAITGFVEMLSASLEALPPSLVSDVSKHATGIKMASASLKQVLDSVLDFGAMAEGPTTERQLEEVDVRAALAELAQERVDYETIRKESLDSFKAAGAGASGRGSGSSSSTTSGGMRGPLQAARQVPTVVIDVPRDMPSRWMAEWGKLRKAISALLSNAVHYDEGGIVTVALRISEDETGSDQAVQSGDGPFGSRSGDGRTGAPVTFDVSISDRGPGMSPGFVMHRLFEPWFQKDQFEQGMGLGAHLASNLIRECGGNVTVESAIGVGTTCTLSFPMHPLEALPYDAAASSSPTSSTGRGRSGSRSVAVLGFEHGASAIFDVVFSRLARMGYRIAGPAEVNQADVCLVCALRPFGKGGREGTPASTPSAIRRSDLTLPSNNLIPIVAAISADSLTPDEETLFKRRRAFYLGQVIGPAALDGMESFLEHPQRPDPRHVGMTPDDFEMDADPNASSPATSCRSLTEALEDATLEGRVPMISGVDSGTAMSAIVAATSDGRIAEGSAAIRKAAELALAARNPALFRILIVEDNPVNMKLLTTVVKRLGFNFQEAYDGAEAVAKFKSFEPDLVLLDLGLPVQDGFEACRQMRAHAAAQAEQRHDARDEDEGSPHVPEEPAKPLIVAVTAFSSKEDKSRGKALGMDDWRTKPISLKSLTADLGQWHTRWLDNASATKAAIVAAEAAAAEAARTA